MWAVALSVAVLAGPARAACTSPLGLPGEWLATERDQYVQCILTEGERARRDPYWGIRERQTFDSVNRALFGWATHRLNVFVPDDLKTYIDGLLASRSLTEPVKAGIRDKFETYRTRYQAVTDAPAYNAEAYKGLIAGWGDLRAELTKMREATNVQAEKDLLDQKILEGDALTDTLTFAAIARMPGLSADQVRRIVHDELKLNGEELDKKVHGYLQEMVTLAKAKTAAELKAEDGRKTAQEIADYAELSRGLLQLGAMTGLLTPEQTVAAVKVVSGVSQISTAVVLSQAGAASTVGAYGMALSGALTLASAFERQGPSEGAQIMGMLRQISQQIADLHYTVVKRFDELDAHFSQTEMRIMDQFGLVLQGQGEILARMDGFQTQMAAIQRDLMAARHEERLQRAAAFTARISYDDARCLRAIAPAEADEQQRCIALYEQLTRDFVTDLNARMSGAGLSEPDDLLGPEEQIALLFSEYNRVGAAPLAEPPAHRPTLAMLSGRLNSFVALNPGAASDPRLSDARAKLGRLQASTDAFVTAFTSEAAYAGLRQAYDAELERVLAGMAARTETYAATTKTSLADQVRETELASLNEASSMRGRAASWAPAGGGRIFEKAKPVRKDAPWFAAEVRDRLGEHGTIAQRLTNYSAAALVKEPVAQGVFPERAGGHLWVSPCNRQSGRPAVPIARAEAAKLMSKDLLALTSVSATALDACYELNLEDSNRQVGIGNTNTGVDVVVRRLKSEGYKLQGFGWCPDSANGMKAAYAGQPEYAWSFEKCHHGHYHQTLQARTSIVHSVTVKLTLDARGYQAPVKSTTFTAAYPEAAFDMCLLPADRDGARNVDAVLLPFRQEFPLVTSSSCAPLEDQIVAALGPAAKALDGFLDANTTRRDGASGPAVTYRAAARELARSAASANYQRLVEATTRDLPQAKRLATLHFLLSGSESFTSAQATRDPLGHLSPRELRDYVELELADSEGQALRPVTTIRPASRPGDKVLLPAS